MSNIVPVKQAPLAGLAGYGGGVPGLYFLGADGTSVAITKSVRFNDNHEAHLTRTPSSDGNRRTWTWAAWVKRSNLGGYQSLFADQVNGGTNGAAIYFNTGDDRIVFEEYSSGGIQWKLRTQQRFRDTHGWYHLTVVFNSPASTANERMRIYVNGSEVTDFADRTNPSQNFQGSLNRARETDIASYGAFDTSYFDGYLADIYFIDGSALDPTSFGSFDSNGVWQAATFSGSFGNNGFHLLDFANESAVGHDSSGNNNDFTAKNILEATGQYLDDITGTQRSGFPWSQMFDGRLDHGALPNAGSSYTFSPSPTIPFTTLQIYAYKDSSPGTLRINGTDVTSQVPNHNGIGPNQLTTITGISSPLTSIQNISNGNLANIVFAGLVIDGELLLDTAAEVDVLFDVPQNGDSSDDTGAGAQVSGNYATLNVLETAAAGGNAALSNGNLQIDGTSSEQFRAATIPVSSGKWYFEIVQREGTDFGPGVWAYPLASSSSQFYQNTNYRYNSNGGVYNQSGLVASYSNFAVGDVIGTALDLDNGKVYFSKNGTWQNSGNPATQTNPAATGLTGQWVFGASTNGNGTILNANFGQRAFAYNAPSGFKALCTTNLPTPTIADGSDYFEAVLYNGNQTAKSITTGHASDFVWLKVRNQGNNHFLFDSVRGVGRRLMTSGNNDEDGDSSTDTLTSFNSNGFSLGADTATGGVNANSAQMVAYSWVAASSTATNNTGSITSSVRANQTAGFSIVTYTGTGSNGTVGHGLNAALDFITVKRRDANGEWRSWHSGLANNKGIDINSTNAAFTDDSFNTTIPTSSVFTLKGGVSNVNANYATYVAYCFTAVAGYSAFGSYTGKSAKNFQYTGFQPRWVMIKNTSTNSYTSHTGWAIFDTERPPAYNVNVNSLFANNTNQEGKRGNNSTASAPDFGIDILSNGFCLRDNGASEINLNNESYIYLAFANNPFQANGGLAR